MIISEIRNVRDVLRELKARDERIQRGLERGLKKAGLLLQRWSQLIAPVDTGLMRASAYTRVTGKGANTVVAVGYTSSYAIYVHENLDAAHGAAFNEKHALEIAAGIEHSRGPNQQARFLIEPAIEHKKEIVETIRKEAYVG